MVRGRTPTVPDAPYCVATIVFEGAIIDFETFSIVIKGRRLLLERRDFDLCAHLLWAEGEFLSNNRIMDRLNICRTQHTRVVVGRLVRRLAAKLSVHGLDGLLERRRGMCRLNLQGALTISDPAEGDVETRISGLRAINGPGRRPNSQSSAVRPD
jgi:hypothetical protein